MSLINQNPATVQDYNAKEAAKIVTFIDCLRQQAFRQALSAFQKINPNINKNDLEDYLAANQTDFQDEADPNFVETMLSIIQGRYGYSAAHGQTLRTVDPHLPSLYNISSQIDTLTNGAISQTPLNTVVRDLLVLIVNGQVELYLTNFFQHSQGCLEDEAANIAEIAADRLFVALSTKTTLSLQDYYGKNDPKHLRGKLKPGFSQAFEDTDQLANFLARNLLFEEYHHDQENL